MLALIIDALGSYFLTRKFSRWIALIPLAVLLGVVSSFSTNLTMHYVWPSTFPPGEALLKAVAGSVLHPLACLFFMWGFRRRKLKISKSGGDPA